MQHDPVLAACLFHTHCVTASHITCIICHSHRLQLTPLEVHSTYSQRPPYWSVLSHIDCFTQCQVMKLEVCRGYPGGLLQSSGVATASTVFSWHLHYCPHVQYGSRWRSAKYGLLRWEVAYRQHTKIIKENMKKHNKSTKRYFIKVHLIKNN